MQQVRPILRWSAQLPKLRSPVAAKLRVDKSWSARAGAFAGRRNVPKKRSRHKLNGQKQFRGARCTRLISSGQRLQGTQSLSGLSPDLPSYPVSSAPSIEAERRIVVRNGIRSGFESKSALDVYIHFLSGAHSSIHSERCRNVALSDWPFASRDCSSTDSRPLSGQHRKSS